MHYGDECALRKQKDEKASERRRKACTHPFVVREQNRKSETTVLNPNDKRAKERPSFCKKFSIYLWIAISCKLRNTSIIDRKKPDKRMIYKIDLTFLLSRNATTCIFIVTCTDYVNFSKLICVKNITVLRPDTVRKLIIIGTIYNRYTYIFLKFRKKLHMLQISKILIKLL